ncbi:MAG: hypothetical protein SO071_06665 [Prevotella sp.]|nr:hypothetical protein [Prevotella sp.]
MSKNKKKTPKGVSHSSFFILHSSFRNSPYVRRVTGGYQPKNNNQKPNTPKEHE